MDQSGQVDGPSAIYVTDDSYWVALGLGPKNPPAGSHVSSVVQLDRKDLSVREVIDFGAWEVKNNPDKGQELTSNPVDIAVDKDGKLYIADASGNSVLTWTKQDGIQLFAGWPIDADGNVPPAVPTAVSIGPDGDIYIGFLSGYPFPTKGARIERYSPDGKLKETYDNLTLVTDVLVTQDGTIYAVQFADSFTDSGYNPKSGSIVTVSKDGLKTIADKLNFPYGLAQNADGKLFIAVNTAFGDKDSGQVISIGST
jgi:sugar lactone lactonase YvrE